MTAVSIVFCVSWDCVKTKNSRREETRTEQNGVAYLPNDWRKWKFKLLRMVEMEELVVDLEEISKPQQAITNCSDLINIVRHEDKSLGGRGGGGVKKKKKII